MFKRAVKTKFNDQKFVQISTMRMHRIENEFVQSAGKRVALCFGLLNVCILIKYARKDPSHKAIYIPMRKGLGKLETYPVYEEMAKGGVYGYPNPTKGKPTLF